MAQADINKAQSAVTTAQKNYDAAVAEYDRWYASMRAYQQFIGDTNNCYWKGTYQSGFPMKDAKVINPIGKKSSHGDCGWKKDEFYRLYGTDGSNGVLVTTYGQAVKTTAAILKDAKDNLDRAIASTAKELEAGTKTAQTAQQLSQVAAKQEATKQLSMQRILLAIIILVAIIFIIAIFWRFILKK